MTSREGLWILRRHVALVIIQPHPIGRGQPWPLGEGLGGSVRRTAYHSRPTGAEMPESVYPWLHLVGRVLFASFLIVFGLLHLTSHGIADYMRRKDVPGPKVVAWATGLMVLVGGVSILLGWHRFIGAGLVFLALFPSGWALHPFWTVSDPEVRQSEMAHFLKALAIAGAALLIAFYGSTPWPLSLGG
jgi:putative oxidoreductase